MAWCRSTKQRRSMARRRGRNGDFKRRFLDRALDADRRHMRRLEVLMERMFEYLKFEADQPTIVGEYSGIDRSVYAGPMWRS